ncbi:Gamma-aminobutyric acid type B receptor subunit 1 [Labeo rohita]|uniref:Gamma-aminobutyric acid type B receptor subunit 1 n=1 Tax=Labeo rohita TaxID=84645 RepID=A0ABQ8L5U6_LABRO|nr:Gamma-aminobutyric acid type B receptor subunit 1 [Labeo rohita]
MQQLDHIKEESDSVKEELKHAYELRPKQTRTRRAPNSPPQNRTGSPLRDLPQASPRPSHGMDLEDLDKLARNIIKFNPNMPGGQAPQAYLKEFADPELERGLVAALETKQGRHKTPQAYYS